MKLSFLERKRKGRGEGGAENFSTGKVRGNQEHQVKEQDMNRTQDCQWTRLRGQRKILKPQRKVWEFWRKCSEVIK